MNIHNFLSKEDYQELSSIVTPPEGVEIPDNIPLIEAVTPVVEEAEVVSHPTDTVIDDTVPEDLVKDAAVIDDTVNPNNGAIIDVSKESIDEGMVCEGEVEEFTYEPLPEHEPVVLEESEIEALLEEDLDDHEAAIADAAEDIGDVVENIDVVEELHESLESIAIALEEFTVGLTAKPMDARTARHYTRSLAFECRSAGYDVSKNIRGFVPLAEAAWGSKTFSKEDLEVVPDQDLPPIVLSDVLSALPIEGEELPTENIPEEVVAVSTEGITRFVASFETSVFNAYHRAVFAIGNFFARIFGGLKAIKARCQKVLLTARQAKGKTPTARGVKVNGAHFLHIGGKVDAPTVIKGLQTTRKVVDAVYNHYVPAAFKFYHQYSAAVFGVGKASRKHDLAESKKAIYALAANQRAALEKVVGLAPKDIEISGGRTIMVKRGRIQYPALAKTAINSVVSGVGGAIVGASLLGNVSLSPAANVTLTAVRATTGDLIKHAYSHHAQTHDGMKSKGSSAKAKSLLEVLTISEIETVVGSIESIVDLLMQRQGVINSMYAEIYEAVDKAKSDTAKESDGIFKHIYRYLKGSDLAVCMAAFNPQLTNLIHDLHPYCFRVARAGLSYCEKSLAVYK